MALSTIKYMGLHKNVMIGILDFKLGGGEAHEVKVRDAIEILTESYSCTVIC